MDIERENSPAEKVILNCIAALTTCPRYENMTPWEVYDLMVKNAEELFN